MIAHVLLRHKAQERRQREAVPLGTAPKLIALAVRERYGHGHVLFFLLFAFHGVTSRKTARI